MPEWLTRLISDYGHIVVFFGVFLENAGLPVPGETTLLAAAFLAQRGVFHLPWIILTAMTAAILGDNCGFWIGRRGGRRLAEKHGPKIGLTATRLATMEGFFTRHGPKTVFFARFIAGLRVFGAPLAGMSRMPWRTFLVWNAVGAVAWASAFGALGYVFGQSWSILEKWIGRAAVVAVTAVGVVVLVLLARRYGKRFLEAARTEMLRPLTRSQMIHGVVGAVAFGALWVLAYGVHVGEWTAFDERWLAVVHETFPTSWQSVMRAITTIGSVQVLFPILTLTTAWAAWRREWRVAIVFLTAILFVEIGDLALKEGLHRARPSLWAGYIPATNFSFPSGHSMSAVAGYGLAAVVIGKLAPRARPWLAVFVPVLALAIGLSRMALGVHYPTDVMGGYATGLVVYCAAVIAMDDGRTRAEPVT